MKKNKKSKYPDFRLIKDTAGKISNGVYIKNDGSEIIIAFAWGDDLRFRPLKEGEKSL
jgi:hypothetical protein